MTLSKAAFAALLIGTAAPALAQSSYGGSSSQQMPAPAAPQAPSQSAVPTTPQRNYNLSRQEQQVFQPAIIAVHAGDWAAAQTALATAAAAARSADAKYLAGQIRLQIGRGTNSLPMESQALDEMIASGGAHPDEMRALYEAQYGFAIQAGDAAKAENAANQLDQINPSDPNRMQRHIDIRVAAHDAPGAIAAYQAAVQANLAAHQPVPVEWRRQMASIAYRNHLPQTPALMRDWLAAAPTPALWHDALTIYGSTLTDPSLKLDLYRLVRAAGAMTGEREIVELAEAAGEVRAIGEVQAVLQDGVSRNLIVQNAAYAHERLGAVSPRIAADRASLTTERASAMAGHDGAAVMRLAESYYGYGDYAAAAELFRAAIQKGGIDANTANMRLGEALALGGQRAPAEAAFHQVTGPRAEIAQYWLLWLSSRPA